MLGVALGIVVANAGEWLIHKHVLHGMGKVKGTFWSFHWHEHHRACRQHEHRDDGYDRSVFGWHSQGKEAAALLAGAFVLLPLLPVAPLFTLTMWGSGVNYWRVHRRAHRDPDWAREHLPWHYDHHMGPNQDSNWGVTHDWWDRILGTRVPYLGTDKEKADTARRAARAAEKAGEKAAA